MPTPTDATTPPPTWRLHPRVLKDKQHRDELVEWARESSPAIKALADPLQRWDQFHGQLRQKAFSIAQPIHSQQEQDASQLQAVTTSLDRLDLDGGRLSSLMHQQVASELAVKDAKAMSTVGGRGDFHRRSLWDMYDAPSSQPTIIPALLDQSGQEAKDAKSMDEVVEGHYGRIVGLSSATTSAADSPAAAAIAELHAIKRRSLSASQIDLLEAHFTAEEILAALDAERFMEGLDERLKEGGKGEDPRREEALGPDGLPVGVYWLLRDFCVPLLVDLANALMEGKALSEQDATSRIVLKHTGGDLRDLANYLPMPIPDVAQRVLDRALSNRLSSSSLSSFWPSSDLVYAQGAHSENTFPTLQMALTRIRKARELPAMMVILDQAKGIDQIDHTWLLKTLEHYGFGPKVRSLVKGMLLDNAHAVFSVNESLTKPLKVERGILQRHSACSYLFLTAILPLLDELEAAGVGITLGARPDPEVSIPYLASADNVVTFIRRPAQLKALRRRLDLFSAACPGQFPLDKIKTIVLTSPSDENSAAMAQLKRTCPWPVEVFRELVHLGRAVNLATGGVAKRALESALADVRRLWDSINPDETVSLHKKARLTGSEVLEPLFARTSFTPQPIDFAQQVFDALGPFLDGNEEALPMDVVTLPVNRGGLGLPNADTHHGANTMAIISRWLCRQDETGFLFQQ